MRLLCLTLALALTDMHAAGGVLRGVSRPTQAKVEARNKKIRDMVGVACTKGKKKGSHVRPLQALNLVDDGAERVRTALAL